VSTPTPRAILPIGAETEAVTAALRDVRRLPPSSLRVEVDDNTGAWTVCLPVSYRACWDDGFGARGWKLDADLADPEIIASTRETGGVLPTSVLVHDALDHLISGFAPSGHRAEAMALDRLALRTGSDPTPDYRQMIREDLLNGHVLGESAASFIGEELRRHCSADIALDDDRQLMADLRRRLGEDALIEALLARFKRLGASGRSHAVESWRRLGLDPERSGPLGLAMQAVLERIDQAVEAGRLQALCGEFRLSADFCRFVHTAPVSPTR
jgi:hypothetical protein